MLSGDDCLAVYQRLALPFGDAETVRFLLLGLSVKAVPMRGLRALAASHLPH
jgi:hypothetical protein